MRLSKVTLSKKIKPIPEGTVFSCPVSIFLSLSVFLSLSLLTQMLTRHTPPVSLEWLSISLLALLSLQLGTCTTILTSRGLLPAPNTLLPSVSLVVSSTVQHGWRRAADWIHGPTTTPSVCVVVGMTACCPALLKQLCHCQRYLLARHKFVL